MGVNVDLDILTSASSEEGLVAGDFNNIPHGFKSHVSQKNMLN